MRSCHAGFRVFLFMLVFLTGLWAGVLHAEFVTEVGTDGRLTLEGGKKVSLAGIQMDSEGISILRVLTQKQNVRIEILRTVKDASGGECAYAYLKAKYISLPFKVNEVAGEKEVMLNEFLVSTGAAKVDEAQDFARKSVFLKVQEEARRKGEGIWSYVSS